jgi:cyclopropane-fatty-acyl-phospholipid synthase
MLPIVEANIVPDSILRLGIRRELEMELNKIQKLTNEEKMKKKQAFIAELKTLPIAVQTPKANEQHYEVPDDFYRIVLGPYLKYSSGLWLSPNTTLEESEIAMLELYCERAELYDGMTLIDIGCGWGSVTLYVAKKYPNAKITAISNSNSQREYIMSVAKSKGYHNVNVITGDITTFDLPKEEYYEKATRVISIEMFEHMKNYQLLMKKISNWMAKDAKV